ncbi:hypothetical protein E1301_Tti012535 [Triplophysa tibetana]|uniref:Uncharacterized protein n=1 Tax=Triplophysa tibetana TaxID=1572043 RepID=A0A5A9NLZ9_9TELE|nr:hypothetical protein E1301_Tti012535 [Triplophysa tibetana]
MGLLQLEIFNCGHRTEQENVIRQRHELGPRRPSSFVHLYQHNQIPDARHSTLRLQETKPSHFNPVLCKPPHPRAVWFDKTGEELVKLANWATQHPAPKHNRAFVFLSNHNWDEIHFSVEYRLLM